MSIFTIRILGILFWVWLSLFFSFFGFVGVVAYFKREHIRKAYYTLRYPEKVLKVVIHYKTGYYKVYYRLIPSRDLLMVDRKPYYYDPEVITKQHEFWIRKGTVDKEEDQLLVVKNLFVKRKGKKELIHIGDTEQYDYFETLRIREKGRKYSEIHYLYNCPYPLKFDLKTKGLEFSSTSLKEFKDNDLVGKLLTLQQERTLMMLILIIVAINAVATVFLIAKIMGWIE